MIKNIADNDFFYLRMTEDWYAIRFDISDIEDGVKVIDWCAGLKSDTILNGRMQGYYKNRANTLLANPTTYRIWFKDKTIAVIFKLIWG